MRRKIECESCGFEASLSYVQPDFGPADICYCPACGGDISQQHEEDDEDPDDGVSRHGRVPLGG